MGCDHRHRHCCRTLPFRNLRLNGMPDSRNQESETNRNRAAGERTPALLREARSNILASRRALAFDACILAACCVLFYSNNLVLKQAVPPDATLLSLLVHNHLNDFLGGIAFLGYTNLLLDLVRPSARICRLPFCLAYIFLCGLFWEYLAPFFVPGSIADPLDLAAYVFGSAVYWCLLRLAERRPANENAPSE